MVMFSDELQNKKMYQKKKNYINKFSFREIEGDSKRFILCDAIVEEVNSTWNLEREQERDIFKALHLADQKNYGATYRYEAFSIRGEIINLILIYLNLNVWCWDGNVEVFLFHI